MQMVDREWQEATKQDARIILKALIRGKTRHVPYLHRDQKIAFLGLKIVQRRRAVIA
jgi:hypothetical protein